MNVLFVALGSAVGGALRYLVGKLIPVAFGFPLATCVINDLGSFLIGLVSGALVRSGGGPSCETLRLVLAVGFCGGFTTFSTFSNETLRLVETAHGLLALAYVLLSVVFGLAAVYAGYLVTRS